MAGPAIHALRLGCEQTAWRELGFEVDAAGVCSVGATSILLCGGGGGILEWTLHGPGGPASLDGLPTRWETGARRPPQAHPNGAMTIDHVVVTTPDFERTLEALNGAGMRLRRTRQAANGMRQGFFRDGEAIVEVVGPEVAAGDGPAGFWGLVAVVSDVERAAGARVGPVKAAVQPGRRIATVHPGPGLSVRLALITPAR